VSRALPPGQAFELELPHARTRRDGSCPVVRGRVVGAAPEVSIPRAHVVAIHGYLTSMSWGFFPVLADELAQRGIATVLFDLSGGGVRGADRRHPWALDDEVGFATNTYAQELDDVAAVTELVRSGCVPGVDPARGALLGHSRGAAMALVHAGEVGGYRAVVGWSAGGHVGRYDPERLVEWAENGVLEVRLGDGRTWKLERDLFHDFTENAGRYDLKAAARRFDGPLLIVNGARDRATTQEEARAFVAAIEPTRVAPTTLHFVDGAGHNFGVRADTWRARERRPTLREALDVTLGFFERSL
jgi:uncharacterized protein